MCHNVLLSPYRNRMCHHLPCLHSQRLICQRETLTRDARQFVCHKRVHKHNRTPASIERERISHTPCCANWKLWLASSPAHRLLFNINTSLFHWKTFQPHSHLVRKIKPFYQETAGCWWVSVFNWPSKFKLNFVHLGSNNSLSDQMNIAVRPLYGANHHYC